MNRSFASAAVATAALWAVWVFLWPAEPPPREVAQARVVDDRPAEDPLHIEVTSIIATHRHDGIDPELVRMRRQLAFTRYTGFEQVDAQGDDLRPGEGLDVPLVGDRELQIELLEADPEEARLELLLWGPKRQKLVQTTISVHMNKSFMVAGPRIEGGDVLILAVSVR